MLIADGQLWNVRLPSPAAMHIANDMRWTTVVEVEEGLAPFDRRSHVMRGET